MAHSVSSVYTSKLEVTETFDETLVNSSDNTLGYNGVNKTQTDTGSTTVPVTKVAAFQLGTASLDLTAIANGDGRTIDFTGLKVQHWKIKNPGTNANNITITVTGANDYLLGGATWKWILIPGQEIMGYGNDANPDVDATHKLIGITATGAQKLDFLLVAG